MSQPRPVEWSQLHRRVVAAAEAGLREQRYVVPIEVLSGIGWLPWNLVDRWRQGRIEHLEDVLTVRPAKLATALELLCNWAESEGLAPAEAEYVAATRDRRQLRFTADGDAQRERLFRTHWMAPELPAAKREKITQRQGRAPDLVVISPLNDDWTCWSCAGSGDVLFMEGPGPLCLTCADLDQLLFLPAGDMALTRRAKKASGLSAVVVRWSRSRKRYERQGLLVEESALEHAEEQCLADEDIRARRRQRDAVRRADEDVQFQAQFAAEIQRLFPACPAERAEAIARHAASRGSGRVGRTAAARALDPDAVTLAVVASIRHADTAYDTLLMSGMSRESARDAVRPYIDEQLDRWRSR